MHLLKQSFHPRGEIGGPYNGTKLRGIVIVRATYLSFKSSVFPIKRRLAEPLRRSNMLNLVPLGTSYLFLFKQNLQDSHNLAGSVTGIPNRD